MTIQKIKKLLNSNIETVFKKLNIQYEIIEDNIYSTCPVHEGSDNKRAFSFSMNKGIWKCWTRECQSEYRNDILGLIQGVLSQQLGKNVDFKYVLRWCYNSFDIKFDNQIKHKESIKDDYEDLYDLVSMFKTKDSETKDKPAIKNFAYNVPSDYFFGRGFNKKTLKYFDVGDSLEDGIMKERSVIPIHDDDGKSTVGFIGRSTKIYRTPKFLIYPRGFDKRNYLYNYHRAKAKAKETSCIYLVEGQGDVWKLYEAGVKNVVGIFGKTLSDQQEKKISKLGVTHIIVLFDNDQAGKEALIQIYRQINRMYKLTFPKIVNKDIGEMSIKDIKNSILSNLKGTF